MGYRKIPNLYKDNRIFDFKDCYALEKIHGSSAHVTITRKRELMLGCLQKNATMNDEVNYFCGGCNAIVFKEIFDTQKILELFEENFPKEAKDGEHTIQFYGEGYGGKMQKMSGTYGPDLKFIVFEVLLNNQILKVPQGEKLAKKFGLEFVSYKMLKNFTVEDLNTQRDAESVQAIRNGMGTGKTSEGIVIRTINELNDYYGHTIITKHKSEKFSELKTPRKVTRTPQELAVIREAKLIAEEWCTPMRLEHILQKYPKLPDMTETGNIIKTMQQDIYTEGKGEIVECRDTLGAIARKTARLFKEKLQN